MGGSDYYKPAIAIFGFQFIYAGVALTTRAALLQGMNPRVFVVYRQATATLAIGPVAYFSRRKSTNTCSLGLRSFSLIFLASLIGITVNQNIYFEGLYLASSSIASAMTNLVPGITFIIAAIVRMERVNIRSLRSIAKIGGTVLCVSGAVSMALLKGPKLLNVELLPEKSFLSSGGEDWNLGCLLLFGSCCCWSIWLILQVPASANYPDHLSLSAWMCFFATLQSATVTLFIEQDPEAWNLHSILELACCLFSGVAGSGLSFFVQAWCISKRGPLFSAMFNPLSTVIVTILAAIYLHEEIYTGSLIGAIGVIIGLYIVLWGKAADHVERTPNLQDQVENVKITVDQSIEKSCRIDLEEPLLSSNKSP
ncbi:WAT1-related protein [Quillaja saponaria]|uniref:WAT1-related protein n=1 Tax=Quillaja saponaria TaxID=32244 RepID=A0AAD7QDX7_QUISA|nr:WAT1-related protein [Quillaja saponaria]